MHKILQVPELLVKILSYSSIHTNTIAARVCQLWFIHSIPFIWDTVSFDDVLRVLSPFVGGSNCVGFQGPLLPHSWDRFFLYSRNVRQLQCFTTEHHVALKQAVLWRPRADLFTSKLTVLLWSGRWEHIEFLLPLLTSTLQILHIRPDPITNLDTVDVLSKTIPIRSPSLRAFELHFPPVDNDTGEVVSRSLCGLFSPLLELVTLTVPLRYMTREIFTILSLLPKLERLKFFYSPWRFGRDRTKIYVEELPGQKARDEEEAAKCLHFRSLRKLDILDFYNGQDPTTFTTAQVFRHGIQFSKLVELIFCPNEENPDQIMADMESIQIACPNLQNMTLLVITQLPWRAIRPLLKCQALVKLTSTRAIEMDLEDIVAIATNRSSWKALYLPSSKPLSYQALVTFAQHCPDLMELTLTLDNMSGLPDLDMPTTYVKFPSLTTLGVEKSVITSECKVAMFLSCICGNPIKIDANGPGLESWKNVEKMTNFIITTRLENLTHTLKNENALLRAQPIITHIV